MDCIFCKIVAGDIPSEKVYEDERVMAVLDIRPKAPGHTLLIPKKHYQWFYDLPDELSDHLFRVSKKLAKELKEKHEASFIKLAIVGEQVPHTHVHLIPLGSAQSADV